MFVTKLLCMTILLSCLARISFHVIYLSLWINEILPKLLILRLKFIKRLCQEGLSSNPQRILVSFSISHALQIQERLPGGDIVQVPLSPDVLDLDHQRALLP